jgi:predicted Zn-dependent protease
MSTISAIRNTEYNFSVQEPKPPEKQSEEKSLLDRIAPINPLTGQRRIFFFPEFLEIALGGYNYVNYIDKLGGPWENESYDELVQDSLKTMIPYTGRPNLPWRITIVDTASVNAWAKMGGYMAINKSIIERMAKQTKDYGLGYISLEDKIRAVIAHEMIHVALRHSARFAEILLLWTILGAFVTPIWEPFEDVLPFSVESLFFVHYSRSQEYEADKYGMHLMWKCGWDPKAMIWTEHFLKDYEATYGISLLDWWDRLFWTHPTSDDRIKAEEKALEELQTKGAYNAAPAA